MVNPSDYLLSSSFHAAAGLRQERMLSLGSVDPRKMPLPAAEVLFDLPKGEDVEAFFTTLRQSPRFIDLDLQILKHALMANAQSSKRLSFNVYAEGVFDKRFEKFIIAHRDHVAGHTFELLEHGGLPDAADPELLLYLADKYKVLFALDDVSPLSQDCQKRLTVLGDSVGMIKLHFSFMEVVRAKVSDDNLVRAQQLTEDVLAIREAFPKALLLAEGVRPHEWDAHDSCRFDTPRYLRSLGIDAVQLYTPNGSVPKNTMETLNIPEPLAQLG